MPGRFILCRSVEGCSAGLLQLLHCTVEQIHSRAAPTFCRLKFAVKTAPLVKPNVSGTTLCLNTRPCAAGEPEGAALPAAKSAHDPGPSSSSRPAAAPARSSSVSASGARLQQPPGAQQAQAPPAPLQLMHNILSDAACKLLVHEVHQDFRRLQEEGLWRDKLKLNASSILSRGIRSGELFMTCLCAG